MSCEEELRTWYHRLLVVLADASPLLYALLVATPVYAVDEGDALAYTDGVAVYVDCGRFSRLEPRARLAVLLHEALHILLSHVERLRVLPPDEKLLGNIAADAVVDARMRELGLSNREAGGVTVEMVARLVGRGAGWVKTASLEEILVELRRVVEAAKRYCRRVRLCRDVRPAERGGCKGRPIHVPPGGEPRDPGEAARRLAESIAGVWGCRRAGVGGGELERIVARLLGVEVDPALLIRNAVTATMGRGVRRTWARPSRRGEAWPGKSLVGLRRLVGAVDTSGSVGEHELEQLVSAVYRAALLLRPARILLVAWDDGARRVVEAQSPSQLLRGVRLVGGGGTRLAPVLEELYGRLRLGDYLVVASDWHLFDPDEAAEWLARLYRRLGGRILLVATHEHDGDTLRRMARYAGGVLVLPRLTPRV